MSINLNREAKANQLKLLIKIIIIIIIIIIIVIAIISKSKALGNPVSRKLICKVMQEKQLMKYKHDIPKKCHSQNVITAIPS